MKRSQVIKVRYEDWELLKKISLQTRYPIIVIVEMILEDFKKREYENQ